MHLHYVFRNKMLWMIPGEWYLKKYLSKNLQNIHRNKTLNCVVSAAEVEPKSHFEKMAFKYIGHTLF